MIVTISRQLGTDERRILPLLTQQLGIPVIDRREVEATAERLGMVKACAETAEDERLPPSTTGLRKLLTGPKHYADVLTHTVQELARAQSAILVGTAGAEILRNDLRALHIRLVARREDRMRYVREHADVDAESAARLIEESDQQRAEFHATLFGMDWSDPHRYHLVVNTSLLTPPQVVALIVVTLRALQLTASAPSRFTRPTCWQQVTISREYGADGHETCGRLAEALGWACVDHELLHQSAALSGIPLPTLIRIDEHGPGFLERLHTMQESARYFEGLREAIAHATAIPSVIVGRGGYLLVPGETALHLRFVAATHDRIVRTMQEHWLAEGPARALVHEQDAARAAFHRHYFRVDWRDPLLYHAVLNTSRITLESVAEMVAAFVQLCQQEAADG